LKDVQNKVLSNLGTYQTVSVACRKMTLTRKTIQG